MRSQRPERCVSTNSTRAALGPNLTGCVTPDLFPYSPALQVPLAHEGVPSSSVHGSVEAHAFHALVVADKNVGAEEKISGRILAEDLLGVDVGRPPLFDVVVEAAILEVLVEDGGHGHAAEVEPARHGLA